MEGQRDVAADLDPVKVMLAEKSCAADSAARELEAAYVLADEPPPESPVVLDVLA